MGASVDGKRLRVRRAIGTIALLTLAAATAAVTVSGARASSHDQGRDSEDGIEFHPREGGGALPFSESVRVGNLLFMSGQIGTMMTESGRRLPAGGIGPETRQTLENIRQALERRGLTMDDVVKCTVMLADIDEWAQMNEVYRTFFSTRFPARSALGVSGLALGARVEIECIAAFG